MRNLNFNPILALAALLALVPTAAHSIAIPSPTLQVKRAGERICGVPEFNAPESGLHSGLIHKAAVEFSGGVITAAQWNREARVKMACEMRQAFLNKYALVDQKRERLKVNVKTELDRCVLEEYNTLDSTSLNFLDNMRRCLARLQDSHLSLNPLLKQPMVYTGLVLTEHKGRYYILRRSEKILNHLNLLEKFPVGTEVIAIDGRETSRWVNFMREFISSSSELHRVQQAAEAVFARNFAYPKKATVKVKLGSGEEIELPWWHANSNNMFTTYHFRQTGFRALTEANLTGSLEWKGYAPSYSLLPADELHEKYTDDNGNENLSMGYRKLKSKTVCYIQLKTFHTKKWKRAGASESVDFEVPIRSFVHGCEAFQAPLVLDLRSNGGGYTSNAAKLISILMKSGLTQPGTLFAYRGSMHSLLLLQKHMAHGNEQAAADVTQMSNDERYLTAVSEAINNKKGYTDLIRSEDIVPDPVSGGFNQQLITLISPYCVSACEITAAHLKYSQRSMLIGEPTSGTGAGFHKDNEIDSTWKADAYDAFQVKIPNMLFGVAQAPVDTPFLPFSEKKDWLMENQSITPNVPFVPEPGRYSNFSQDILQKIATYITP